MPQRELRAYLLDIIAACDAIARYTSAKTYEHYLTDDQLRSSVERQLFIAGEAVVKIKEQEPLGVRSLGDVDGIVTARNVLAHLYFALQHDKVWDMVRTHSPRLRIAAQEWYEELSRSAK